MDHIMIRKRLRIMLGLILIDPDFFVNTSVPPIHQYCFASGKWRLRRKRMRIDKLICT